VALLVLAASVLFFGLISTSFARIGFTWHDALLLLLASWVGGHINVPIATLRSRVPTLASGYVRAFGLIYRIPLIIETQGATVLAVNVGGAVVPALVSLYLMVRFPASIPYALPAVAVVTIVMHAIARPVRGVGIVIPAFVPPVAAALASTVFVGLFGGPTAACFVTAYVSGTLGTLIGADVLNLGAIRNLGAPVASIGGAGTFDGVFLTGLIAVLLV
jgi:uncharacterized membrane protein